MKTYRLAMIGPDNAEVGEALDFSGPPRLALDAALELAEIQVRKGRHMRITCGEEVVFDSLVNPLSLLANN